MMSSSFPNVLWISFEDTYPYLGCYGDTVARTPHVDQLASEGCRWTHCFSTTGVCAPSRSAVITGMYPVSIGTHHMRTSWTNDETPELPTPYSAVVPHYVKCFTEYFRAAGYYCSNNRKTDYQFDVPITAWDDCSKHGHWRNRRDVDQPFFAVFNLQESHESCAFEDRKRELTFDPSDVEVPPYYPDTEKVRTAIARQYTNIEFVDQQLGELLKQLEEDGLAENTIVVFWSDHGPLPRGKRWPYDAGIKVPMIIRWPGQVEAGSVSDDLISTIDMGPTMMSLCGIPIPQHLQGQAFLGQKKEAAREYIYATRDRYDESYDMVRAVRDQRFKYMRHYLPNQPYLLWIPFRNKHPIIQEMWRYYREGKANEAQSLMFQSPRPLEELYDTENDPYEIHNLAEKPNYKEELERLRLETNRWMDEVGDMGRIAESDMVRSWYPDGVQTQTAAPIIIPYADNHQGRTVVKDNIVLEGVAVLHLQSSTQGASVAYTFDNGDDPNWLLYIAPLKVEGSGTLRAKAIRIGYRESEEKKISYCCKYLK